MTMYGSVSPLDAALLAGVVDGDDRRVVQRRRVLRLAAEPQLERGVAGEVGAQHLDRDVPAEPQVTAAVHLGHAAVAEQLADLVPAPEEAGLRHLSSPRSSLSSSHLTADATVRRRCRRRRPARPTRPVLSRARVGLLQRCARSPRADADRDQHHRAR